MTKQSNERYRVDASNQQEVKAERYKFPSLEKMDKAVLAAFNCYDSNSCSYEKGLIVSFTPTRSLLFDTRIRSTFAKYGGKLISE